MDSAGGPFVWGSPRPFRNYWRGPQCSIVRVVRPHCQSRGMEGYHRLDPSLLRFDLVSSCQYPTHASRPGLTYCILIRLFAIPPPLVLVSLFRTYARLGLQSIDWESDWRLLDQRVHGTCVAKTSTYDSIIWCVALGRQPRSSTLQCADRRALTYICTRRCQSGVDY